MSSEWTFDLRKYKKMRIGLAFANLGYYNYYAAVYCCAEVIAMIIQNCSFTVHFPQNVTIRENLFKLEKHFIGFQKPFTLVPLPPDAPADIPRIVAASNGQHSQLMFTGTNVQLTVRFDDNFNTDVCKCIEYVRNKSTSMIDALPIIGAEANGKPKLYFSGLSISFLFSEEDGINAPIEYISSNFLKCKSNLREDEAQFRVAYVVDEKYYVNVMLQNYREFANGPDERGSFVKLAPSKEGLLVNLDINDRYAFNNEEGYLSSAEAAEKIVWLAEQFASKYVKEFVEKGEIQYVLE